MIALLRKNEDVFAWSAADMPGGPIYDGEQVECRSRSKVNQEKQKEHWLEKPGVMKGVKKLLTTDFIKEVLYID